MLWDQDLRQRLLCHAHIVTNATLLTTKSISRHLNLKERAGGNFTNVSLQSHPEMIHNQAKKIQESSHDLYTLKIKIIVYIWARKCTIGVL